MYDYKCLNDISYNQIAKCVNLAFSDYYLPIQLTEKTLETYFEMSGVDKVISYGAFLDNQMVGFIFNSCNIYNGEKVVFDVGTGVIPEHRGNKVFTNLFKFVEQELQDHHIKKYYLEVLQQNDKAITSYKKQGFHIKREFSILTASNNNQESTTANLEYVDFNDFDFNKINHCTHVQPSYENSINVLKLKPHLYGVVSREEKNEICAFCIFSKQDGRIVQLGYTNIYELKLIIQQILLNFNNIIVKNIDITHSELLALLLSIGFKEVAKQYEMVKNICVY